MYIDPKDIIDIENLRGKGIRFKLKRKRIVICSYYDNYNEVCQAILDLLAKTRTNKNVDVKKHNMPGRLNKYTVDKSE